MALLGKTIGTCPTCGKAGAQLDMVVSLIFALLPELADNTRAEARKLTEATERLTAAAQQAVTIARIVTAQSRWIAVTDGLPEVPTGKTVSPIVLIRCNDGDLGIGYFSTMNGWEEYLGPLGPISIHDPTHWMAIPMVPE